MSSPLDHYIFKEQIENQMRKNADKDLRQYEKTQTNHYDIIGTETKQKGNQTRRDKLAAEKNKDPKTSVFQDAKENYERENPKIENLKKDVGNKKAEANTAWNRIPEVYDSLTRKNIKINYGQERISYNTKYKAYTDAVKSLEEKTKEVKEYTDTMRMERIKHSKDLDVQIAKQDKEIDSLNIKLKNDNNTINVKVQEETDFVERLNGFDTKFMTLITHPNFGVQFLRWFIFVVFLVIEILPTWMKLVGKPREYDIKLASRREQRANEEEIEKQRDEEIAKINKTTDVESAQEKANYRKAKEKELHDKVTNDIASRYEIILTKKLNEWESKS